MSKKKYKIFLFILYPRQILYSLMDQFIDGFNYENCLRNAELEKNKSDQPKPIMANSTVVAVQFKDGIIIGADTRGICGKKVIMNSFNKIFQLHDNVFCSGIGLMSDLTKVTHLVKGQLIMHHIRTNRRILVITAKQLMKTLQQRMQGTFMASFVIAGADKMGLHLYTLHFDGTSEKLLFSSVGSGQFGSMSIIEDRWKVDLDEHQARELMIDAISAGINSDVFSIFNVNLCTIRRDFTVDQCSVTVNKNVLTERQKAQNCETCLTFNRNWREEVVLSNPIVHTLEPLRKQAIPRTNGYTSRKLLRITRASLSLHQKRGPKEEDQVRKTALKKSKRQ